MQFRAAPVVPKSGGAYNASAANTRFDNVLNIAGTSAGREQLGKQWGVGDLGQATGYSKPPAPAAAPGVAPGAAPKPQQPANPRYTHTQDYQRGLNRTGSTMQMVGDRMVVRGPKREAAMQQQWKTNQTPMVTAGTKPFTPMVPPTLPAQAPLAAAASGPMTAAYGKPMWSAGKPAITQPPEIGRAHV